MPFDAGRESSIPLYMQYDSWRLSAVLPISRGKKNVHNNFVVEIYISAYTLAWPSPFYDRAIEYAIMDITLLGAFAVKSCLLLTCDEHGDTMTVEKKSSARTLMALVWSFIKIIH